MIVGDDAPPGETGTPPFLQEPTVPLVTSDWRVRVGQVVEGVDRWRPALLLLVASSVAATIGLAYFNQTQSAEPAEASETAEEQTAASAGPSAFDGLIAGVSADPADGTNGADSASAGTGSTTAIGMPDKPGTRQGEDYTPPVGPPLSDGDPPDSSSTTLSPTTEPSAPSSTESSESSTPASSSTEPTEPTTTTTTTATTVTTEPPEPCTATVGQAVWLRLDLDNDWGRRDNWSGPVPAGDYEVLGTRTVDSWWWGNTTWYQINAAGTVGWVDGPSVSSTRGDCNGIAAGR